MPARMTVGAAQDTAQIASEADLAKVLENALASAGVRSYSELESQAATRSFSSVRARLAWMAVEGIPH